LRAQDASPAGEPLPLPPVLPSPALALRALVPAPQQAVPVKAMAAAQHRLAQLPATTVPAPVAAVVEMIQRQAAPVAPAPSEHSSQQEYSLR